MLTMKRILALLLTAVMLTISFAYAEDAAIEVTAEVEEIATEEPISEPADEPTEEPTPEPTEEPTEEPESEETPEVTAEPEIEETLEPDVLPEEGLPEEELPKEEEELEEEENRIEPLANSGTLGTNLTWNLDSNGTLTITGTGAMPQASSSSDYPWGSMREDITSVVIASGVTSIGDYAFYYYPSIVSVTIPDSVSYIGQYAFADCYLLTSVTIPNGVPSIGDYTFSWCYALRSVSIPNSVTSIGESAFWRCKSLTSITIPGSVTRIGDEAFRDCELLTNVTIPNGVTTISPATFYECTALTSVNIPSSVTTIGEVAFYGCTALASLNIPGNVNRIESWAFKDCTSLTSLTLANAKCDIHSSENTLGDPKKTAIHAPSGSTAQAYAKQYGYKFVATTSSSSSGTTLATPKLISVSNTATGVKIAWNKVSGAARYRVYYRTGTSGSFKKLINTSASSYTWPDAKSGTTYNFTVRCLDSAGNVASSYDSKGLSIAYVAAPKLTSVTNAATGVKIAWGKVTGAARYRVYCRTGTSGSFKKLINTSAGSYTWQDAKSGTTYNFTVRALNSKNEVISSYDSKGQTITYVAAPKLTSVTKASGGIKIAWGKVAGASRYRVYYRVGTTGAFKKLVNTSAGSYTWPDAKSGTTYNFTVRALNSKNEVISAYDSKGLSIAYKK